MRRAGIYECPQCMAERTFVLYDPPWDPNMAMCPERGCGFSFGYMVTVETIVDDAGRARSVAVTKPALSPEVLAAGMKRYQDSMAADLVRRHGGPHVARAMRDRERGLASEDPAVRAHLLGMVVPARRKT